MSRTMPDLSGFDVVKLPSIEERLALHWGELYSVPERYAVISNGEFHFIYKYKIRVFKKDYKDWRLDIREIAESEFGGSFTTQKDAMDKAREYLRKKYK